MGGGKGVCVFVFVICSDFCWVWGFFFDLVLQYSVAEEEFRIATTGERAQQNRNIDWKGNTDRRD